MSGFLLKETFHLLEAAMSFSSEREEKGNRKEGIEYSTVQQSMAGLLRWS